MDVSESEPHLIVERRDGVMIPTMNRPAARNSLSPEMLIRLNDAGYEFRDSADLRVAIEDEVSAAVMASKDAREGPRAFAEKRKPKFIGK